MRLVCMVSHARAHTRTRPWPIVFRVVKRQVCTATMDVRVMAGSSVVSTRRSTDIIFLRLSSNGASLVPQPQTSWRYWVGAKRHFFSYWLAASIYSYTPCFYSRQNIHHQSSIPYRSSRPYQTRPAQSSALSLLVPVRPDIADNGRRCPTRPLVRPFIA